MSGPIAAAGDLLIGVRLAVGGGRRGWARLLLTTLGIGVGVAVLLLAASVPPALSAQQARQRAAGYSLTAADGAADRMLLARDAPDTFRGTELSVVHVEAGGPHAPVPPGLDRVPAPGEIAVSPALADLLDAPDAGLLRARYPQHRVAVIGKAGLSGPRTMLAYVGARGLPRGNGILAFGRGSTAEISPLLVALLVVGVVVLLFPVVVFVVISARLSGSERDRTLAAVRLVGASAPQARRIAAGEALVGAVTGLVLGAAGFAAARPLAQWQSFAGVTPFADDLVPSWPLTALIAVAVPLLAVVATTAALRRTVIEPLGVTRRATTARRRLWWRPVAPVAGTVVLLVLIRQGVVARGADGGRMPLVAGILLVLMGVPAVLPWLLDQVLRRVRFDTPALQLATGRLRAETGPPARVVAGLGVVLAGAIGMSTLLAAAGDRYQVAPRQPAAPVAVVQVEGEPSAGLAEALRRTPGVLAAQTLQRYEAVATDGSGTMISLYVAPCAALEGVLGRGTCRDGDSFRARPAWSAGDDDLAPGAAVRVVGTDDDSSGGVAWRIPRTAAGTARAELPFAGLLATPGAVPDLSRTQAFPVLAARYDPAAPDVEDRLRTAATAALQWRAHLAFTQPVVLTGDQKPYQDIRRGLLAGTLLTLTLAATTMVVAAAEQVRERRRPFAVLAATGVPRALLARSVLWQNAVPLVLAVAVADAVGVLLAVLLLPVVGLPVRVDPGTVGLYSVAAAVAAGIATALTLPSVVRATRPAGLRAE